MNKHYELYKEKVEEFEKLFTPLGTIGGRPTDGLIKDWLKQTFIDIADREIERLEGEIFADSAQAGQFTMHADGMNQAIEDQISYWKEAKELIENHE